MKPLKIKIQTECKQKSVPQHVVEKDYALSYILAGIAKQDLLSTTLIFKGGTALKKIFFGDYRFSEDLDFSVSNAPKNEMLEKELLKAMNISKELLNQYGAFDVQLKRNPENAPHPQGQEAFIVQVKFPWHPISHCRIKIEITHDEPVILMPQYKSILHGYDEIIDCQVASYHIEEVVAEKMRALLQTHQKLVERGWNRPRARDYYDLWRILKNYGNILDLKRLRNTLDKKCKHRNVFYKLIEDFFTNELVKEARQHWQSTLGVFVKDLPECDFILEESKLFISKILFD